MRLDSTPAAVTAARVGVRAWLDDLSLSTGDMATVLAAATELVANVVDHAYLGAQPLRFTVTARG